MKALKRRSAVVLLSVFMLSCGNDGYVSITGSISQYLTGANVRMNKIVETGIETIATVAIDSSLLFDFKVKVDEPAFYRLIFNDRQFVTLILTGEESKVVVHADGYRSDGFSEVSGSKQTDLIREMDRVILDRKKAMRGINQKAIDARRTGDTVAFRQASVDFEKQQKAGEKKLKELTRKATPSPAAYYGVQLIDFESNFDFVDSIANALIVELPGNHLAKELMETVDNSKKLKIGAVAPEIAQATPDGEMVTLSSLKGSYVLIDFWASWCKPCREENPHVVGVYNRYRDKNFEILGVSLDRTKAAWVNAIKADGLPWKHVSDLNHFNNEAARTYQIHSIPATYLIDPEGKIMAKGLRGKSLEEKLKEIFG